VSNQPAAAVVRLWTFRYLLAYSSLPSRLHLASILLTGYVCSCQVDRQGWYDNLFQLPEGCDFDNRGLLIRHFSYYELQGWNIYPNSHFL